MNKTSSRLRRGRDTSVAKKVGQFLSLTTERAPDLNAVFASLRPLGEVVIFGGLLRNAVLFGLKNFRSDIDLVVTFDEYQLNQAVTSFNPKVNAFGGYRVRANSFEVDVWPLSSTWAFRRGLVQGGTLEDLTRTTFFNWDAIAFSLTSGTLVHSENYFEDIEKRYLDIVLIDNPNPTGMVERTLRLMRETCPTLSPTLAEFLVDVGESMIGDEPHVEHTNSPTSGSFFSLKSIVPLLKRHLYHAPNEPFYSDRQLAFWNKSGLHA